MTDAAADRGRARPLTDDAFSTRRSSSSEIVFEGKIWNVRRDDVRLQRRRDHARVRRPHRRRRRARAGRRRPRAADQAVPAPGPRTATGRSRPACSTCAGEDPLDGRQARAGRGGRPRRPTTWDVLADVLHDARAATTRSIRIYLARGVRADRRRRSTAPTRRPTSRCAGSPLDEVVDAVLAAARAEPVAHHRRARRARRPRAAAGRTLGAADAPWPRHGAGARRRHDHRRRAVDALPAARRDRARALGRTPSPRTGATSRVYAAWLAAQGIDDPPRGDGRATSSAFAAAPRRPGRRRRSRASSLARMLSTVRGFHRFLLEEGCVDADVAREVAAAEAAQPPAEGDHGRPGRARCSPRPTATSLQRCATRRCSSCCTPPARGSARPSALNVDDVIDGDVVRLIGKGSKQRIVPLGSYARAALDAYLVRARPGALGAGPGDARAVPRDARGSGCRGRTPG